MALQLLARLFTSQPRLPAFDELPPFHDMPGCGWIWGEDDQLGTVNLLSDKVVQRACREEVQYVQGGEFGYPFSTLVPTGLGSHYPLIGPSLLPLPSGYLLLI